MTGHDGREDWVLVHVEVQGDDDVDFPQRMFVYTSLYDRYGRPVASLAVLGAAVAEPCGTFGYLSAGAVGWPCGFRS